MGREKWFDQEKAEKFTGKNRVTLWHWRATGKLVYKKIGNQVFYEADGQMGNSMSQGFLAMKKGMISCLGQPPTKGASPPLNPPFASCFALSEEAQVRIGEVRRWGKLSFS